MAISKPAPAPPGARIAATDRRRGAILDAALRSFAEHGYAATTIEDVRRRSGASVGSIYHHFGGKQELFGALYVDGLADYQEGCLAALEAHPAARPGIEAMVRHHLGWVEANPDLARYLLGGREAEVRLASEATLRERNRAFFGAVEAWLAPHVEAGRVRRLDVDVLHSLLIGPSQELCRHRLAREASPALRSAARPLAAAAWRSLSTQEDGP